MNLEQLQDAPTRVTEVKYVEGNGPAYCEVRGYVLPQVGLAIRLPAADWNGKFVEVGCAGHCGEIWIDKGVCDTPVREGFACIVSDMGHQGTVPDGMWAYNNPQAEIDFAYRAAHVTSVAGKEITARFYGTAPRKSYFMGCSQGGRQGLVAAQRFPWDFDGIIVGAPAIEFTATHNYLYHYWLWSAAHAQSGGAVLPPAAIELIHEAAIAQCDLDDGVKDGIIGNPPSCAFRPAELACEKRAKAKTAACLSPLQVEAAQRLYSGVAASTGEELYPGAAIGSELSWIPNLNAVNPGWIQRFRYLSFVPDPGAAWQPGDFVPERDHKRLRVMEALYSATNPDLRKFKAAGGKLIMYTGWNDDVIVPKPVIDYYETVQQTMGGREATQAFFRLFMLPGVKHCSGGSGADAVDFLSHLDDWVEQGRAPESVLGAHVAEAPTTFVYPYREYPTQRRGVKFTRPVYPYPQYAVYRGSGDPNAAENFRAAEAAR